jgi:4-hydroxybenzoate polyprenyltransferase
MDVNIISRLQILREITKFEHTVFVLPFAYMGAFWGSRHFYPGSFPTFSQILWITLAISGARSAAMLLKCLIDRQIDARNPRTAARALAVAQIKAAEFCIYLILSLAVLSVAAYQLSLPALQLLPAVVVMLLLYLYSKRFTWACHFLLGATLGLAPLGAWIGTSAAWAWPPLILGLDVLTWAAGFDIIFACRDVEFDRQEGLHAIPAQFGLKKALWISAFLHVLSSLFLIATGVLLKMSWLYYLGVGLVFVWLLRQHCIIKERNVSRQERVFFKLNLSLSSILFVFTLLDLYFY